jgi:hypothetical protein
VLPDNGAIVNRPQRDTVRTPFAAVCYAYKTRVPSRFWYTHLKPMSRFNNKAVIFLRSFLLSYNRGKHPAQYTTPRPMLKIVPHSLFQISPVQQHPHTTFSFSR